MLHVRDLQREVNDRIILTNINFTLQTGDILFVRGPSGVGKSLLLRALAYLDPIQVNSELWVIYEPKQGGRRELSLLQYSSLPAGRDLESGRKVA